MCLKRREALSLGSFAERVRPCLNLTAAAGPCKRNFVPLGSRGAAPACFLLLRFLYTSKENAVAYSETGHSSSFIIIPSGRTA